LFLGGAGLICFCFAKGCCLCFDKSIVGNE